MSSEVATTLAQYENRAKNLLVRLGQLADHLRQVLHNPQVNPDWPTIVTHFRVTESQLEQLAKDVHPFLQYFVLRPVATLPPNADVPLMLSSRSHLDMEGLEKQLQTAFWDEAHPPDDVMGLINSVNEAVGRIGTVCDWRLAEFKDGIKRYKSPGMEEASWKKEAKERAEKAFSWLEAKVDGR